MLWDKGGGSIWGNGGDSGDFLRGVAMGRATAEPIPVPVQVADVETTAQLAAVIKRLQGELYETQQNYARARAQGAALRAVLVALAPLVGRDRIEATIKRLYPGAYAARAKEVGRDDRIDISKEALGTVGSELAGLKL